MVFDPDYENLLNRLITVAKQKIENGGTFTEFTGLIGELAACKKLGYIWAPIEGHDATDPATIPPDKKIQIKTRRLQTSKNLKAGTLGRFGSARYHKEKDEYPFDIGILVVLDLNFEIARIGESTKDRIEMMEAGPKDRQKQSGNDKKLSGLNVSTFINYKNSKKKEIKNEYEEMSDEKLIKSLEDEVNIQRHTGL
jgi:hypothetical protein